MVLSEDPEIRRKQLAAIFAKQRGNYTDGRISSSRGIMSSEASNTITNIAIGAGVGATATFFPPIVPMYKAYTIVKIGKKIYDSYDKSNNKQVIFDKLLIESTKYGVSETSGKLSEGKVAQLAKNIRIAAESGGIISQIAKKTNIDEEIYSSMFEGTIKEGIMSGVGDLATYTIGGLVS